MPASGTLDLRHRPNLEIEALRAIAIAFVLVMHAPLLCMPYPPGALQGIQRWIYPATGVDLFFVISGYLMGRSFVGPYEATEDRGTAHRVERIAAFWVRRFYRLVPASALWVVLTFLASLISDKPSLWLPPNVMFAKGIAALASVRNFEESQNPTFFGYYWSLSVENQFYIALPIALLLVPRRWRVRGLIGLCLLNAVWRPGGELWWLFRYDGLVYGLLLFELERSGAGAILALCLPRELLGRSILLVSVWTVLVTMPVSLPDFHPLAWTLVNCAGFILVFTASQQQGFIAFPRPLRVPAAWLGARSYSLYLCHIPIWFTVIDISQRVGLAGQAWLPLRFAVALSASLLAADLTYRWLELPLQERGRRHAARFRSARDAAPGLDPASAGPALAIIDRRPA